MDFSPIQGGHGNIEFLAYLKKEKSASNQIFAEIKEAVERAQAELMDKMINLQVIPGNTAFVKAQLIDTFADKIFSCLTDDSSILVIARSGSLAEEIFEQVKNW
ncbi:transcriptional repressor protein [Streptococcus pneumoniae]|nr:transcriptional repressor protein [Streptococcus pneumoniae]